MLKQLKLQRNPEGQHHLESIKINKQILAQRM